MKRWTALLGITLLVSGTPALAEKPISEREPLYIFNAGLVYGTFGELCGLLRDGYINDQQFNSRARAYVRMFIDEDFSNAGLNQLEEDDPKCTQLIRERAL
jgi:hypothetical protein